MPPPTSSQVWKAIMRTKPLLLRGCCKSIGSNRTIHIWQDPWILLVPNFKVLFTPPSVNVPIWCSDLINSYGDWNLIALNSIFRVLITREIWKVSLPVRDSPDGWCWPLSPSRQFIVKSAYLLDQSQRFQAYATAYSSIWRAIQKAKIHTRHKLLWLCIALDILPTRSRLNHIFPIEDVFCPLCSRGSETIIHLFHTCSLT